VSNSTPAPSSSFWGASPSRCGQPQRSCQPARRVHGETYAGDAKVQSAKSGTRQEERRKRGRARVRAIRARGSDQLKQDGRRLYNRQLELYGAIFANRVNRNPEARREARRKGGLARQAQRKIQKMEAAKKLDLRQRDSATQPVIALLTNGNVLPEQQASLAKPITAFLN
jgi:hypothetical protein